MLETSSADLGGLSQLGREPRPLGVAQHGLGRIGIGHVALLARRTALVGALQRGAEPAHVEQDDLHPHARRADECGIVDALTGAPHVAAGTFQKFEELILGGSLCGKSPPPSFRP